MTSAEKLSTGPSRTCARGLDLDVDGNINISGNSLRPRAHACTWREACKAADYVLEHFGNPLRDRGIWVWYCQRLGLNQFLDLADEVISSARQGEVKSPKTTQTHCRRRIHLPKAIAKRRLRWCPKHLCALLAPPLWLINYVLPQRGHREAQRFLELGLRPKPQTTTPESEVRNEGGKVINRGKVINSPLFGFKEKRNEKRKSPLHPL